MSSAFHIEHEDGRTEIVYSLADAIVALVEIYRTEEAGSVEWSS